MAGIKIKPLPAILAAAMLIVMAAARGAAEITCGKVVSQVSSCVPYVTDRGPIGKCCDGIKALNESATTTKDRQKTCECLKTMAKAYTGINYGKAAGLPKKCGVDVPYTISPDIDCSKVK